MQDLYVENYKTLMKEIKGLNKWRKITGSWIEGPNIVRSQFCPNRPIDSTRSPSKSQQDFS